MISVREYKALAGDPGAVCGTESRDHRSSILPPNFQPFRARSASPFQPVKAEYPVFPHSVKI